MTFVWWLTTVIIAVMFLGFCREALEAYKARTKALVTQSPYGHLRKSLGATLDELMGYTDLTKGEEVWVRAKVAEVRNGKVVVLSATRTPGAVGEVVMVYPEDIRKADAD